MYIHVRLLTGYDQVLTYAVPPAYRDRIDIGTLVRVPLRARIVSAVVVKKIEQLPTQNYTIRPIADIEPFPADMQYHTFLKDLGTYYQSDSVHFIRRIRQFLNQKQLITADENSVSDTQSIETILTAEQQTVYEFVAKHIAYPTYTPTLLHGITGSGKTEVYKRLIVEALAQNRSVVLLLPEVTLALQFERLLRMQLPSFVSLYSFHCATSARDKKKVWAQLVAEKPVLIIGVHLPILLPIAHLGLIIVDEEHELNYQEKKHPKIHTKEAALLRAQKAGIPILLGSATPAISSLYNVHTRGWHLFNLTQRFAGSLPTVTVVSLTQDRRKKQFWVSRELEKALADRLAKQEQTIIFLNRRGHSFFVQCMFCSFIFTCRSCSVSLTLHNNRILMCHYCGYQISQPSCCPSCKNTEKHFVTKGIGTQQVVTILQHLFPHARIGRADLDTTNKKKEWALTLQEFEQGKIDILVGTQTITKGYHFPCVTLVGVIWGDLNLHFPTYTASESTLQQLIQVAGRAGRHRHGSEVIVQTMVEHPLFKFLNEIDYIDFYEQEIRARKEVGYPPCSRFVEIELKSRNPATLDQETAQISAILIAQQPHVAPQTVILGPTKPAVHMIKNMHERSIYLKGPDLTQMIRLFQTIEKTEYTSSIFFTPNPTQ